MLFYLILALILFHSSKQHFMPNRLSCVESYTCSHDAVTVCGLHRVRKEKKWFMDLCDMKEYNCDNDEEYESVKAEDCVDVPFFKRRKGDFCATTESYVTIPFYCTRENRKSTTPLPPTTTEKPTTQTVVAFVGMTVAVTCPYDATTRSINETMLIIICKNSTVHATTVSSHVRNIARKLGNVTVATIANNSSIAMNIANVSVKGSQFSKITPTPLAPTKTTSVKPITLNDTVTFSSSNKLKTTLKTSLNTQPLSTMDLFNKLKLARLFTNFTLVSKNTSALTTVNNRLLNVTIHDENENYV